MGRLKIYLEMLRPTRRWLLVVPLAALGTVQSIRDEFLPTAVAEAFKLPIFLPNWSSTQWLVLVLALVVILTLEGGFQAVASRESTLSALRRQLDRGKALEDLLGEISKHQQTASELYSRSITNDADLAEWVADVMDWRQDVAKSVAAGMNTAAAQDLDTVDSVSAASTGGAYNDDHNTKKLYLYERMRRLRALASQLQSELRAV